MLFETHSCPAAFIGHSGMFSAFCAGRPTSLVLDFGARETRVTPVVDGFVLRKAVMKTARGGNWLDKKLLAELESHEQVVKPWFEKTGVVAVDVSTSFRDMHVTDVVRDIKKWMCFVPKSSSFSSDVLEAMKMPPYELPDGTMVSATMNICTAPAALFASGREKTRTFATFNSNLPAHCQVADIDCELDSLQDLIHVAIGKCDVDTRKDLLANITGSFLNDYLNIIMSQKLIVMFSMWRR